MSNGLHTGRRGVPPHEETQMTTATTSYIHPLDYVRRRRWTTAVAPGVRRTRPPETPRIA